MSDQTSGSDQPPPEPSPPRIWPPPPPPPPPARVRSPAVATLMVIGGVILLLPGLCAFAFLGMVRDAGGLLGPLGLLWLVCFAISAGGVAMIVKAFR